MAATLTSFFARAVSQKQTFNTMDEFFAAASAGELKSDPADWLPPSLLVNALTTARTMGKWSLLPDPGRPPRLRCEVPDKTVFIGQFTLKADRVDRVAVQVAPASQPAGK
jgi:hypothetical protein